MAVAEAGGGPREFVLFRATRANRVRALGPVAFLLLAQLVFYLIALNASTVLPGNWSGLQGTMLLYIVMNGITIGVFSQGVSVPLILEGNTGRFLKTYAVTAAVTSVAALLYLWFVVGGIPSAVPGTVKLQLLVVFGIFVGPSEELVFRVVLPPLLSKSFVWQVVLSSAIFGGFHIGAYTAAGVAWTFPSLLSQLFQAGLLGGGFFLLTWKGVDRNGLGIPRWGYAAGSGAHTAWDLTVSGVIGGMGSIAHAIGLVAI